MLHLGDALVTQDECFLTLTKAGLSQNVKPDACVSGLLLVALTRAGKQFHWRRNPNLLKRAQTKLARP